MPVELQKRSEIEKKYTWNLESIFPDVDAWKGRFAEIERDIPNLERHKGHLGESAEKLLEWMEACQETAVPVTQVFVYAVLYHDGDTTNQDASALRDQAQGLLSRFQAATAFAEPEILSIPQERIAQFMEQNSELAAYSHYFDQLWRKKDHIRSEEVEALLALAEDPLSSSRKTHAIMADAELDFGTVEDEGKSIEVTGGTIMALMRSPDINVRKAGWEQHADGFLRFKNTLASAISGGVKRDVFFARARNYSSSLDAALEGNFIPKQVYENILETSRRKLPVWHRYWSVKRRALGLDMLHAYDVFAPLTKEEPKIGFEESVDMICEGMGPLGEEYCEPMRKGLLEERWVDVFPNVGKRSGAYSSGTYGTNPFILMSYSDDITSVSTLAHELGHSMHSYLSRKEQKPLFARYGLFVAEVASNFNQAMVRARLLETRSDPQFQIATIEEAMYNFHRYFFVMPILARFEREIHERMERGEALTADGMNTLMADLFREGYGPEVEVDEPRVGITWAQFSTHMYLNFYVYQYATGIAAANALASRVLKEGPQAAEDYKRFLKAGGSLYPLDALKVAGVDMTSPEPVESAFDMLEGYVDRLEKLTT